VEAVVGHGVDGGGHGGDGCDWQVGLIGDIFGGLLYISGIGMGLHGMRSFLSLNDWPSMIILHLYQITCSSGGSESRLSLRSPPVGPVQSYVTSSTGLSACPLPVRSLVRLAASPLPAVRADH
jgi:hypothetical protein